MAIVPCSMKTLAGVAHGLSRNLVERAADVMLKERRPLVIVPRETPMSLPQLKNMVLCAEAGAAILPAMPAFYQLPKTIDDLADFIAGKILSALGFDHDLYPRGPAGTGSSRLQKSESTTSHRLSGAEVAPATRATDVRRRTRTRLPEPSKSPARIAGMFDAIAGRYDLLNHLLSAGIDRRWRRRAIGSLSLTGRERVLDLCTGTADLAIAARTARPPAARVVGVDFAGAMLRSAREAGRVGLTGRCRWYAAMPPGFRWPTARSTR